MGYNGCCVGGAIQLRIDKQSVRVFKLTKFKLTLCSIIKFKLLVMQYESTCIYRHKARINKRAKEVKPDGHVLWTWIGARDRKINTNQEAREQVTLSVTATVGLTHDRNVRMNYDPSTGSLQSLTK